MTTTRHQTAKEFSPSKYFSLTLSVRLPPAETGLPPRRWVGSAAITTGSVAAATAAAGASSPSSFDYDVRQLERKSPTVSFAKADRRRCNQFPFISLIQRLFQQMFVNCLFLVFNHFPKFFLFNTNKSQLAMKSEISALPPFINSFSLENQSTYLLLSMPDSILLSMMRKEEHIVMEWLCESSINWIQKNSQWRRGVRSIEKPETTRTRHDVDPWGG